MTKIQKLKKLLDAGIQDVEESLSEKYEKLDDESKAKIEDLIAKAKNAVNTAVEKTGAVITEVKDKEKVDEFIEGVEEKSQETFDFIKAKIEEFADKKNAKNTDDILAEIFNDFEKVKESDTYKKATDFVKGIGEQVNEYLNKPEVKQAINKAKKTTINIAEKGVDGLKKILTPEEEKKEEE